MTDITGELARFAVETELEDLPERVLHETKLLLLDHVGCALGGLSTERGRMAASHAREMGGPSASSIIGVDERVSPVEAAFANGELMVALDFSNIVAGGHDGLYVIPTLLAMAERAGASGEELLVATAVGQEISARIGRALGKHAVTKEAVRRMLEGERGVTGNAYSNFGAAGGAGRLLGLDGETVTHALGIAGHLTQVLSYSRWGQTDESYMAKYGTPGWQDTGAVRATLLAERGYTGDVTVLDDPEHGFAWFAGYDHWDPEGIADDLGEEWWFNVRTHYKPYPCCGAFHCALDCFYTVLEEHDLAPDEIDHVTAYCRGEMHGFPEGGIEGRQFDPEYVFGVAALRVPRGPEWYAEETMNDPDVEAFGEKVTTVANPEYDEIRFEDPLSEAGAIEVEARGETYTEERRYRRGTSGTDAMLSDEELAEKFRRNADHVLPDEQVDRAIDLFLGLEDVEDATTLMDAVTP